LRCYRSRRKLLDHGLTPAMTSQTLAFIQGEQQKWAPIVQQIGPVQ